MKQTALQYLEKKTGKRKWIEEKTVRSWWRKNSVGKEKAGTRREKNWNRYLGKKTNS